MKNKGKGIVYLSGGIQNNADLGRGFRVRWTENLKKLGYVALDVLALDDWYTERHGKEVFRAPPMDGDMNNVAKFKAGVRGLYILPDIHAVRHFSDAVILQYDDAARQGAGTFSEAHEAYMQRKPLFVLTSATERIPGWLVGLSTKVFTLETELYSYLKALPDNIFADNQYTFRINSFTGEVFSIDDTKTSNDDYHRLQLSYSSKRTETLLEYVNAICDQK